MIKQDIISFVILIILAVFGCLLIYGSVLDINENLSNIDKCKRLGGVPQTDSGEYLSCAKPDNFINIGAKQ